MEKLTLASMEHLPSAVVLFVLDLSATSGVKSTVTSLSPSLPPSLLHTHNSSFVLRALGALN